jgi:hypothetical protein
VLVEEGSLMPRTAEARMDAMERKIDELLKLSHDREDQLSALSAQVAEMAPTVKQVADAVTFAKVGRSVFRVLIGTGMFVAPVIYFMQERWGLLAQIFKRIP